MTTDEKFKHAMDRKTNGNKRVKQKDFNRAIEEYKKGLTGVEDDHDFSDEQKASAKDIKISLQNNMALCHLKLGNVADCIEKCGDVLALDPKNVKAFIRRAQAHLKSASLGMARKDVLLAKQIDSENKVLCSLSSGCRECSLFLSKSTRKLRTSKRRKELCIRTCLRSFSHTACYFIDIHIRCNIRASQVPRKIDIL